MKIKTQKKDYQISGATSKTFSVDTNDTMVIKLLRDKMYKNKIGAVAREISSNSRDANREAGRNDSPIVITISSENNLLSEETNSISFQDNGVGISPERMDNIFLKYGGSTKRDSDEFTGGFGIGAKTPFAYTDNFFISTIVEEKGKRLEYLYQAIITSDGKNEVSRMIELGSNETTSQTGTKITVPLKSEEDRKQFEKEVVFCTNFWSVKPIIKGFEYHNHIVGKNFSYENEDCIIFSDSEGEDNKLFNSDTKYVALIDEIPYAINHESVEDELGVKLPRDRRSNKWVLKFKTGEITVSGSREDIEYVKGNLNTIYDKYSKVLLEGRELVKEYHNKAESYLEACSMAEYLRTVSLNYYSSRNISEGLKGMSLQYIIFLGEIVATTEMEAFPDFGNEETVGQFHFETFTLDNYEMDNNNRMVKNRGYGITNASSNIWGKDMYELDLPKAVTSRNAQLKQQHSDNGYVLIRKLDYAQYKNIKYGNQNASLIQFNNSKERDEKLLNLIGLKLNKYSEVERLTNSKKRSQNKTEIVKVNVRILNKNRWEMKWESASINYDKKGEVFLNATQDINTNTPNHNITSFCYYEKDKLSDFKIDRYSGSNVVNGIPSQIDAIRQILLANGIQTIGISSSKVGYFKNVPTIKKALNNLMSKDKDKLIENCIQSAIIKSMGVHNSSIINELNAKDKIKSSLVRLSDKYKNVIALSNRNLSVKTMLNIFNGKVNSNFLKSINIELEESFTNDIKVANKCLNENPILKMILDVSSATGYGGYRLDKSTDEFKNIVSSYTDTCKVK
jgi:hypothetical protein